MGGESEDWAHWQRWYANDAKQKQDGLDRCLRQIRTESEDAWNTQILWGKSKKQKIETTPSTVTTIEKPSTTTPSTTTPSTTSTTTPSTTSTTTPSTTPSTITPSTTT